MKPVVIRDIKLAGVLLFLLEPITITGQLSPVTNQYILNPMTINPAFAGRRGALNISSSFSEQWVGIKGSPHTVTLSADAPFFDKKIGLGVMITSDKFGITNENQLNTSYAYNLKLGAGILSFGLGAGVIMTNTAFSKLVAIDPGDEQYLADSRTFFVPNFNFGIYYSYGDLFAGLSIPRFLNYEFDFTKNSYILDNSINYYTYMLNTGYLWEISSKIKYFPSALIIFSGAATVNKMQFDINSHFIFFERFWLGASYRSSRSVSALVQFQPNDQIRIAYTYGFEISKLGRYSYGSHEIMLRFTLKYKVDVQDPLVF
jgi:type IX secretion system PorP/SprF family membrane protein